MLFAPSRLGTLADSLLRQQARSLFIPKAIPEQFEAMYRIDQALVEPAPDYIAVVDDMLTAGAHCRAAKSILSARFPKAVIVGLFIARWVPARDEFGEHDNCAEY